LSQAAALTTLGIAVFFLANSPLLNGQGISGDWTNVTYGVILLPWGGVLWLFASRLMVEEIRHVIWGGLVVVGNALTGIFIMATFTGRLVGSSFTLSQGFTLIAMMISPALGVVGGLLGIFWKTSWKHGAAVVH
jgi:hypothetical protein